MAKPEKHVFVCDHSRPDDDPKGSCVARGSQPVIDAFAEEIGSRNLWGRIKLSTSSCLGTCEVGPSVLVYPEGVMYQKVKASDVVDIIEKHLIGGDRIESLEAPADLWG